MLQMTSLILFLVVHSCDLPGRDGITFVPRTTKTLTSEETQHFLDDVRDKLGVLKTLQAHFLQQRHMAAFVEPLTAHGTCYYMSPDKIRWEMTAPYRSALVFSSGQAAKFVYDGDRTRKLNPGSKEVLQEVMKLMCLWMRGDFSSSQELFSMRVQRDSFCCTSLTPRSGDVKTPAERVELILGVSPRNVEYLTVVTQRGARVFKPAEASQLSLEDIRLKELAEVESEAADQLLKLIPQWLHGDLATSGEVFRVQLMRRRSYRVRLTPRSSLMKSTLTAIELSLNEDSMLVDQVTIHETRGDRIVVSFVDQVLNEKMVAAQFALD